MGIITLGCSLTPADRASILPHVEWQSTLVVAAILVALGLVLLRVEPRIRRRVALVVPLPLAILIIRWALYRRAWPEVTAAIGLAAASLALWWILIGRRLPPPAGPSIRVWSKDEEM
jgi:hypothetical protein